MQRLGQDEQITFYDAKSLLAFLQAEAGAQPEPAASPGLDEPFPIDSHDHHESHERN